MDERNGKPEVVVITGASAGVGRATAVAFAKRGARVGLLARGRDGLKGARAEVESAGGKACSPRPTSPTPVRSNGPREGSKRSLAP